MGKTYGEMIDDILDAEFDYEERLAKDNQRIAESTRQNGLHEAPDGSGHGSLEEETRIL